MFAKLHGLGYQVAQLVRLLLESLDTPRALTVWLLFSEGEHGQLVDLDVDPNDYDDGALFAKDYQATKLLSKACFLKGLPDPKERAIQKFREAETACRATNRRMVAKGLWPSELHGIFHSAARSIAAVLGEVPYESVLESCGWGPGVSSSCKGSRTTGYDKFTSVPDVTPDLLPVAHHVINSWLPWPSIILKAQDDDTGLNSPVCLIPYSPSLSVVRGNKVAFVPKNSKTDRAIAVEPTVNAFLQKGIGSVIRRKLRKHGVDLSDQGRNRYLARVGAIWGDLCTVDLESASDTIALELVRELLPPDWFRLLDVARSKWGSFDDEFFFWEKFSSMGNGFTFELESLIFWALTKACSEVVGSGAPVSVYGDDIICGVEVFPLLKDVFSFAGFTVNPKKSFPSGPFRESCGNDFFRGLNVRPFFLKEVPDTPIAWMNIANSLREHSCRQTEGWFSDESYRPAWRYCVARVPKKHRFFGPRNVSGVFWIHESEKRFSSWSGCSHKVKHLHVRPRKTAGRYGGAMLLSSFLYAKDSPTLGKYTHRQVWDVQERTTTVWLWDNIGPWG